MSAVPAGALTAVPRRVAPQPGEVIDRSQSVHFTWNGDPVTGFAGDTITSALMAAGTRVFSRSFKYHRPRGPMTASFWDPGCLVQVGAEPNVRTGHRRLVEGMEVRAQNAWPSLGLDVKAANQAAGRFLTAGFYYKTFMKPRRLWPVYERVLASFVPGGRLADEVSSDYFDKRYVHVDVCIAGGGPAGMAAAVAAAEAGASVLLVEDEHDLGGHLRWGGEAERATLAELKSAVERHPAIEVMTNAVVTGRYDENWIAVVQRGLGTVFERLVKTRARTLVAAPGLVERPYVFSGNDIPGVMVSTGVRRLINLYGVRPGARAVVFTANDDGDTAADDLRRVGAEVTVVDARTGGQLVSVDGGGRGRNFGVRRAKVGAGRAIECDLVVTAVGWTAPTTLLNLAGDRPAWSPAGNRFVPGGQADPSVLAAGGLTGDGTVAELVDHARAVGLAAASPGTGRPAPLPVRPHPALFRATHGMVDLSEDVSSKDLVAAVEEGYSSVELVKRYTTVTMGSAQGKLETVNAVAIVSEALGQSIEQTGTTVWRPPYAPLTLGGLAGRMFEPVRYSPMQPWHVDHGAVPLVAGEWIRPDHYGDAHAEVRRVRSQVGIIDVTPLGKLELRGPDIPRLLNLLYVNKWSKLAVGAVRYGVMCGEDGVVIDDGVCGRLAADHYFMSTTSSGASAVWEMIEYWLQVEHSDWDVIVTPMTDAYASINVAGPRSRELLARLVDGVDLDRDAFGYMNLRQGGVAGVDGCYMWRIGFTGELSYELHIPAAYGLHVWEQLLSGGADLGCGPFGVEAQRIMRLEKGHFIVGQDTDGLTQAFGADLGWLIKLDKEDFTGKQELAWQLARDDYQRLVGLQPADPAIVPDEGSQIVEGNTSVGRITSSRWSPTLERSICLAFVAPHLAAPGTSVVVKRPSGDLVKANVTEHHAHFDPEGVRLRG